MRSQPVAVREVGDHLVHLAEGEPLGRAPEFAGPREEDVLEMVRAYAKAIGGGAVLPIRMGGEFGRAQRDGSLLPDPHAKLGHQTYAQWIRELPAS